MGCSQTKNQYISQKQQILYFQVNKHLYENVIYLWIDQDIQSIEFYEIMSRMQQKFNLKKCLNVKQFEIEVTRLKQPIRLIIVKQQQNLIEKMFDNQHVLKIYVICFQNESNQNEKKNKKIAYIKGSCGDLINRLKIQYRRGLRKRTLGHFLGIGNNYSKTIEYQKNLNKLLKISNKNEAKNDFQSYTSYIFKDFDQKQINLLDQNSKNIFQYFLNNQNYFKILNDLISSTYNINVIKYARLPFYHIYQHISSTYLKLEPNQFTIYSYIKPTLQQLNIILNASSKQLQLICFLKASTIKNQKNTDVNIQLQIKIKKQEDKNNYGYCFIDQNTVIFNPLNVFQILKYQRQNNISRLILLYGKKRIISDKQITITPKKQKKVVKADKNGKQKRSILSSSKTSVNLDQEIDLWVIQKPKTLIKTMSNLYRKYYLINIKNDTSLNDLKGNLNFISSIQIIKGHEQSKLVLQNLQQLVNVVIEVNNDFNENVLKQYEINKNIKNIILIADDKPNLKLRYNKISLVQKNCQSLIKNLQNKFNQLPNPFPPINFINNKNKISNPIKHIISGFSLFKDRFKAKQHLIKLIQFHIPYQKQTYIKKFKQEYTLNFDLNKVLQWYQYSSFFQKITSNLLKLSTDPLQLSYIRLPFQDLFKAIKLKYNYLQKQQFFVYSGNQMREDQLKQLKNKKGKTIQLLGFLKGTKDKNSALKKVVNVFWIIKVTKSQKEQEFDYGYTWLKAETGSILFNAFNTFKIEEISQYDRVTTIILKYGSMAELLKKKANKQNIQQFEQKYLQSYLFQKQILSKIRNQGNILTNCKKYEQSLKYYKKLTQILENRNLLKSQKMAIIYYQIGRNYDLKGQTQKALQNYFKFLTIPLTFVNEAYQYLAVVYNNIGSIQNSKKNYEKALQYYFKCLGIQLKTVGQNHSSVATTYNNIASVYSRIQDYNKSIEYYEKCFKVQITNLGDSNELTAFTMYNIGCIYKNMKNMEKALQVFRSCRSLYLKIFGSKHNNTINLQNLIMKCQDQIR